MAGMFYSIQETAKKLGITEDGVKQLAKDGKLREFRDGENIMFKVDEVDNIYDRESALQFDVLDETPVEPAEDSDILLAAEADPITADSDLDLESPLMLEDEGVDVGEASSEDLDMLMSPLTDNQPATTEDDDLGLLSMDDLDLTEEEPRIDLLSDTQIVSESPVEDGTATGLDEIGLSDGTTVEPSLVDDLAGDTAITGEGISVLGETDADYKLTDDTMAETLAGLGATGEASLEEIEEDVNLDSFGSGSGLLDLSLQADDTSLGGILDEIYTSDDEDAPAPERATTSAMAAEVDPLNVADELPETDMGMAPMPIAGMAAAEVEPDACSNTLGALLFLPLFLIIYTAIVTLYATSTEGKLVSAAAAIKGYVWIVMGALFAVALIWAIVGFTKGSTRTSKPAKAKKAKTRTAKPKKEKAPKEKKAQKGLFAKKK